MNPSLFFALSILASPPTSLDAQEARVAACAGLPAPQRALAGRLREQFEKLALQQARLQAERQALEQARQDLLWLAESIEQERRCVEPAPQDAPLTAADSDGPVIEPKPAVAAGVDKASRAVAEPATEALGADNTKGGSARSQRLKLIKIVGKMKPAAASQLLVALEPALAEQVVAGLRPAQAAKVLAAMDPARAAPIAAAIAKTRARGTM